MNILLLSSFSLLHGMESTIIPKDLPASDTTLQKLITAINDSSLNIVNIIKKNAQDNYVQLNSHTIKSFLNIDKKIINQIFLANIEDDELRPFMLAAGADINCTTSENHNCIWQTKKPAILKELIKKGAATDTLDIYNKNRLFDLLSWLDITTNPQENLQAAQALLEGGAKPDIAVGSSVILHKTISCTHPMIRLQATKLLCNFKANTNVKDYLDKTPLLTMVEDECHDIIQILLENKANPNIPDKYGNYPLNIAMRKIGNENKKTIPAIVILLLQYGANPNTLDPYLKNTPLHIAVSCHLGTIIKKLIECGAEKHHLGDGGLTAFEIAQKLEHYSHLTKEVVDLLNPNPHDIMTFTTLDYVPQERINNKTNKTTPDNKYCAQQ